MKPKKTLKRKRESSKDKTEIQALPPAVRQSDEPVAKKKKWINKQRVLIFALRGITFTNRHLMNDLKTLMPHGKKDCKLEKSINLSIVNEIAEGKNCNKCLLFENRRKTDLYLWMSNIQHGPSIKFQVENVYTMKELKLTGNCLQGSRPLLSFDENFNKAPHYKLMQELITQIFSTPNHHPKSQPFIDHVLTFSIVDHRIWFRNYQILSQDGALAEIGPRFVLNPIKIFAGSFSSQVLWENPHYVSTAMYRRKVNQLKSHKYEERKEKSIHYEKTRPTEVYKMDQDLTDIFEEIDKQEVDDEVEVRPRKQMVKKKKKKLNKISAAQ